MQFRASTRRVPAVVALPVLILIVVSFHCYDDGPIDGAIAPISLERGKIYSVSYSASGDGGNGSSFDQLTYTDSTGRSKQIQNIGAPWNHTIRVSGDSATAINFSGTGSTNYRHTYHLQADVSYGGATRTQSADF